MTKPAYRPEIDGLRAVAVIPVILYHAGVSWMPGGFLGVDVFFVISGYLISRLLLSEFDSGRTSIAAFYGRRARRILPLLFLVIAATFPLSWWLMPPDSFAVYLGSLRAATLSFSNIYFWHSSGYFSPAAEEQPLLHTWSLSVEEQFYLIFPLLLFLLHRFARERLLLIFGAITVVGFLVCVAQVWIDRDVAFFMLHARAWELSAGVTAAMLERRGGPGLPAPQLMSAAGILAIAISFVLVLDADRVPGMLTLLPVAGTTLVILAATPRTATGRMLSARAIVSLGLVSYGAYLWHHPLFAFARLYSLDRPSPALLFALALAAFVLAALTWKFIEMPFRSSKRLRGVALVTGAASAAIALSGLATAGLYGRWDTSRFDAASLAAITPAHSRGENCKWSYPVPDQREISFCPLGTEGVANPVVLWGDSHAQALIDELDKALEQAGISGVYVASDTCLRLPGIYAETGRMDAKAQRCEKLQEDAYAALERLKPRHIIVSLRWTFRMFPLPGAGSTLGFDNGEGGVEDEDPRVYVSKASDGSWSSSQAAKTEALTSFLSRLSSIAPVTVVGPIPEVGWNIANINFKSVMLRGEAKPDVTTSSELFAARNAAAQAMLKEVQSTVGFTLIEPALLFCDTALKGRCLAQWQGKSLYADDDHVSATGAAMIMERLKTSWTAQP